MSSTVNTAWSSADLAKEVCDVLVADGKLKEKPAFIRTDREKKIAGVFQAAKLDGAKMAEMTGRAVEVAVRVSGDKLLKNFKFNFTAKSCHPITSRCGEPCWVVGYLPA